MNEVLTFPLVDFIKEDKTSLTFICVPLVSSDEDLAMVIKKRLNDYFSEVFYVSWKTEDNSNYITYDKLEEYTRKYVGCLFITSNVNDFAPYMESVIINSPNTNYFITFNDIFVKKEVISMIKKNIGKIKIMAYWPMFADLDIKYAYDARENYLTPSNTKMYNDTVTQIKHDQTECEQMGEECDHGNSDKKLEGILNVYLDNTVKSLTELDMNKSLLRSPKFKNMIIDLLLNNKIRHYIYMIDGAGGIDSFKILYDKVKKNNKELPVVIIIKQSDSKADKREKINSINETNSPIVVLSDINFENKDIPMNIDSVKITNGGNKKIINTIFNLSNAKYYTGVYPRKISVVIYMSKNTNEVKTLDQTNYNMFKSKFINMEEVFTTCRKNRQLFIEGDRIMIRAQHDFVNT